MSAPSLPIVALRFLSWDPHTEEAEIAFLYDPDGEPDGGGGYVGMLNVRHEAHARELVRRWNESFALIPKSA